MSSGGYGVNPTASKFSLLIQIWTHTDVSVIERVITLLSYLTIRFTRLIQFTSHSVAGSQEEKRIKRRRLRGVTNFIYRNGLRRRSHSLDTLASVRRDPIILYYTLLHILAAIEQRRDLPERWAEIHRRPGRAGGADVPSAKQKRYHVGSTAEWRKRCGYD
jgi:hypothetical protein